MGVSNYSHGESQISRAIPSPLRERVRVRVKVPRIDPQATSRARGLRRDSTDPESTLWNLIRNRQLLGFKFRRQVPVGKYIADFACLERKLIIELDGGHHQEQTDYDAERTEWLESRGFSVMRFWNNEIQENVDGVLGKILLGLQGGSS